MSLRRLFAIMRKEFIHIRRDPRSLGFALVIPLVLMFLECYAINMDVDNIPICIMDMDHTEESKDFIELFRSSRYFKVHSYASSYRDIFYLINKGECRAGIIIPRWFARYKAQGTTVPVQLFLDGSDPTQANITLGYVSAAGQTYTLRLLKERAIAAGALFNAPVDISVRIWFNEELKSKNYIIPGLVAFVMAILAAMLTSLTISREWDNGTMELLISTPVKTYEVIFGKLIPYVAIGFVNTASVIFTGLYVFNVPMKGSWLLLTVEVFIFLIAVLMLGITISVITRVQMISTIMALFATFLPTFLLSGFVFPISSMHPILQAVSYVVPAKYFLANLDAIFLKGVGNTVGISSIIPATVFLIVFALVMIIIANARFKKYIPD